LNPKWGKNKIVHANLSTKKVINPKNKNKIASVLKKLYGLERKKNLGKKMAYFTHCNYSLS
jgi:hypothetical protein